MRSERADLMSETERSYLRSDSGPDRTRLGLQRAGWGLRGLYGCFDVLISWRKVIRPYVLQNFGPLELQPTKKHKNTLTMADSLST